MRDSTSTSTPTLLDTAPHGAWAQSSPGPDRSSNDAGFVGITNVFPWHDGRGKQHNIVGYHSSIELPREIRLQLLALLRAAAIPLDRYVAFFCSFSFFS